MGILQTDENGMLLEKDNKIHNLAQKDAFVRFAVEQDGIKINLWNCQELFDVYIQYVLHGFETKQMCYVSGREEACAEKHPAKIRNSADKAKLISGNDDTGFTYRGRFESRGEAVAVSYVTSQKAHNALRWLLQKQGYLRDGSAIVTWKLPENDAIENMSEEMIQTPDIMENTVNAFSFDWEDEDADSDDTAPEELLPDIGTRYAILLNRAMDGYAKDFTKEDRVIMIALDAATTGRLSINFYHEFEGNQFIQNVIAWHREASWKRWVLFRKTGKYVLMENAPSPREIVLAAYGTERTKGYLDCEPKLLKNAVQRILPCIVGIHKNIPKDILRAMVARASNPQAYSLFVWENQVFAVACAMLNYRNKKIKKEGEQIMDAEMEKAILFGKLLAILDESERKATYDPEQKSSDKRLTNAKKLWNAYTRRPKTTFERLHSKVIQAYSRNLSGGTRQYMEDETMKLVNRLNELERFDNRPLKEEYLLGYYEQKEEIKNFKGKDGGKNNG
jgi:CRISPR-associated protein Csd1